MNKQRRRSNRLGLNMARRRNARKERLSARALFAERLEDRRLLTGFGGNDDFPFHNMAIAADVSGDWFVSPRDALIVINELNTGGSRVLDPNESHDSTISSYVDTNADNRLTPIDALRVINALNDGEGQDPLVGFRLEAQDASGNALANNQVKVGEQFRIQVYVQDLRAGTEAEGVFAAFLDMVYNNGDLFSLGGTNPADFATDTAFDAFWTKGNLFQGGSLAAYPWTWTADPNGIDNDSVPDEFDEAGAFWSANLTGSDGQEYPLVYVTLTAEAPGTLSLQGNPAELMPASDVLLFAVDEPIPTDLVDYGLELQILITQPVNAVDDSASVNEDGSVLIDVLANDFLEDGSTGTKAIDPSGFTGPAHGSVAIESGQVRYTPAGNYFGLDSFVYTAIDGLGNSDTATVTIDVSSVNDPPVAVDDIIMPPLLEDSGANSIDVLANDNAGPANEDQALTIDPATLTQPAHGTVTLINGNTLAQYTPAGDYFGADSFTYSVIDSGGLKSGQATVTLQVDNVNDPPIAQDDVRTGVLEDSVNNAINVRANDSPGPNESSVDSVTITGVSNFSDGGSATIASGQLLYTPAPDFFGTETFTYSIRDNAGLTDSATVTVTVNNVNDPVDAVDDTVFVDELTVDNQLFLLANDTPGPDNEIPVDVLLITAVTLPDSGGTVTIAADGKSVFYSPETNKLGPYTETFEYTMSDGEFSDTALVTVNVEPVIRPRARDDNYDVLEDSLAADNIFDVMENDLFNEGAVISPVVIVTPPQHGTASVIFNVLIQYQPDPEYFGTDTLEYRIDDDFVGDGGPSQPDIGLVTFHVLSVNDPPIATDDDFSALTILEDSANNQLNVLANDKAGPDNETESIFVVEVTQPAHGTVTIAPGGGSVLYTPDADYFGSDSFSYTMSDGELTDSADVSLVVTNVNDDPTANNDTYTGILEDSLAADNVLDVLSNDTIAPDVQETLTITSAGNNGLTDQGGTVTISGDNILYQPKADFFGTDTFTYTISDGNGGSDSATVTVVVNDVNDNPVANDDLLEALKDFTDQELDVLANDSILPDVGETLTIIGLGPNNETTNYKTPHGTASISADGLKIIYTPDLGFKTEGDNYDTFTYTISDGREGEDVGNVSVNVIDAVPSDISGVIYMDVNNNGIKDPWEIELAGVEVTLVGTNLRGEAVSEMATTDVHGKFLFQGILPNAVEDLIGYAIHATNPEYTIDGIDRIVDASEDEFYDPGDAGNDVITGIDLGVRGTTRADMNYEFGERGMQGKFITIAQYLSSTRKGIALATNTQGDDFWFTVLQGWEGVQTASVQLASDLASAQLTIVDVNNQTHVRTISYRDYHLAGDRNTGEYMIYFNGSAADLGFDLPGGELSANERVQADGEAPMEAEQVEMYAAEFARGADEVFAGGDWA